MDTRSKVVRGGKGGDAMNPYMKNKYKNELYELVDALDEMRKERHSETDEGTTRVSCTFVKCEHNNYGKLGICQCKYIQMGELVSPGSRSGEPVCVYYKRKANET